MLIMLLQLRYPAVNYFTLIHICDLSTIVHRISSQSQQEIIFYNKIYIFHLFSMTKGIDKSFLREVDVVSEKVHLSAHDQ